MQDFLMESIITEVYPVYENLIVLEEYLDQKGEITLTEAVALIQEAQKNTKGVLAQINAKMQAAIKKLKKWFKKQWESIKAMANKAARPLRWKNLKKFYAKKLASIKAFYAKMKASAKKQYRKVTKKAKGAAGYVGTKAKAAGAFVKKAPGKVAKAYAKSGPKTKAGLAVAGGAAAGAGALKGYEAYKSNRG